MRSKELRAQRAKLIEDARALISGESPSEEDTAKFDAAMVESDKLKAQIDRIERADDLEKQQLEALHGAGKLRGTDPEQEKERQELEEGAFRAYMRGGVAGMTEEQRAVYHKRFQAALGTTPDTAGGYTVPQGFMTMLVDAELAFGGMLAVSYIVDTTTGNSLPIPTDNDTTNEGVILGENTQVSTQDVTFGAVTLNAHTYSSKLVLVANQLLQDSAFNLDAFLARKLGTRLARITNRHFTVGTGASQPTGVITASPLGYTAGGSTSSGETTSITYDDLVELEHSIDPAYRANARFMMHDTSLKTIKKLKDGLGRPLWLAGIAVKEPDTINGYPYMINQHMAVPAASAKIVAFGDFQNYFIRRVAGVQVLRLTERYADFNQTGFLAFQRWDGQLVDAGTHPIRYLQNSAT